VRVNKNCVRVYVRLFVCVCVCVYVCVWVWVCVWNKTDLYVYKSTYIHMCVYVHIHVCEYDVRFSPRAFSYVASATSISQSLSFSLQQQRRGISLFLCVSLLLARAPSGCQCWFGSPVPSAPLHTARTSTHCKCWFVVCVSLFLSSFPFSQQKRHQ